MLQKMTKTQRILFYITIILVNIVVLGENVIMPITYNLYEAFPDQTAGVNFIISGPSIILVAASILAGKLLQKFSTKTILLTGGFLFIFGTVFGLSIKTIPYIIFTRCCVGISEAFVNVAALAMIAEVYEDEQKRASFVGIFNAFMNLLGVAMGQMAGILAAVKWEYAYRVYWVAIPMVIMVIFFLPYFKKNPQNAQTEQTEGKNSGKSEGLGKAFWTMDALFFVYNLLFSMVVYYISVYIAEHSLGNETLAGTAQAMITLGGFVFCLFFGPVYKKLGNKTMAVAYGICAVGIAVLFVPSVASVLGAMLLAGGSYGIALSYSYAFAPSVVPASKVDESMGIITATYAAAMFVSTYLMTWLMNNVFHSELVTPVFMVPLAMCILITAAEWMTNRKQAE